jgi:TPR repeat protein
MAGQHATGQTRPDLKDALDQPRQATENGYADAQFERAVIREALDWTRRAAEHGDADAQFELGRAFAQGEALELSFTEAAHWYRRAAEQYHARAQLGLGSLYFLGLGVAQDYLAAHMWLNISAARLPQGQAFERALALRNRVAKMLTPEHLVEAQRMAHGWLNKRKTSTAEGGDPVLLATLAEDEIPGE